MSFKENAYQQISFTDSFSGLTAREQKALEGPGQKFSPIKYSLPLMKSVFPFYTAIRYPDRIPRSTCLLVRLSSKSFLIIPMMRWLKILCWIFGSSTNLHTTSFEEQPLSDKTLSCFRKRRYDCETLYNKNFYHDCVKDLSASIAKLMGISGKIRRMDSIMIEFSIRRFSRMELIYTCIAKLAVYVDKINDSVLPDGLKHYIDPDDFNRVIHHQRSTNADERMKQILTDADNFFPCARLITMIHQSMICLSDACQNRPLSRMKSAGSTQKKTAA